MTSSRISLLAHAVLALAFMFALAVSMRTLLASGLDVYAAYERFTDFFILPGALLAIGWIIFRRRTGQPVMAPADEREAEYHNRFYKVGFWVFYLGCMTALTDDPTGFRQNIVLFATIVFASAAIFVLSLKNAWQNYVLERGASD